MLKRILLGSAILVLFASLGCGKPGMGSNQLKNLDPRVLIATVAMHELLDENPEMDRAELARKAFEVADAMIAEAGRQPAAAGQ